MSTAGVEAAMGRAGGRPIAGPCCGPIQHANIPSVGVLPVPPSAGARRAIAADSVMQLQLLKSAYSISGHLSAIASTAASVSFLQLRKRAWVMPGQLSANASTAPSVSLPHLLKSTCVSPRQWEWAVGRQLNYCRICQVMAPTKVGVRQVMPQSHCLVRQVLTCRKVGVGKFGALACQHCQVLVLHATPFHRDERCARETARTGQLSNTAPLQKCRWCRQRCHWHIPRRLFPA